MFLVSTRNFPPELGGIQNLIEGLSISLLNHGPVKVFTGADTMQKIMIKIQIKYWKGFKIFRKYRKELVKEFLNQNQI